MSKKETFDKLIRPKVWKSLSECYRINVTEPTEGQSKLVDLLVNEMYDLFGNVMTVKDLQEKK